MDTNNADRPSRSFRGRSFPKSRSWYRDVKIARNMMTDVTEKQSATRDEIANTWNAGWFSNTGLPLISFTPPGKAVDVAKATVAIRAATTEQDSDVLSGAGNEPRLVIAEHGGEMQRTVAVDIDGSELALFDNAVLEQQLINVRLPILHRQQHNVLLLRILVVHCHRKTLQYLLHHLRYSTLGRHQYRRLLQPHYVSAPIPMLLCNRRQTINTRR